MVLCCLIRETLSPDAALRGGGDVSDNGTRLPMDRSADVANRTEVYESIQPRRRACPPPGGLFRDETSVPGFQYRCILVTTSTSPSRSEQRARLQAARSLPLRILAQ